MARRHLTCSVCGSYAGWFEQHWNRDAGYGICSKCVAWRRERGEIEEQIRVLYGEAGINYQDPTTEGKVS